MGPEDLREAEIVHRFGGFVAQYLGDGVLAYFGYQAHEDDAERAVRAALELIAAGGWASDTCFAANSCRDCNWAGEVGNLLGVGDARERGRFTRREMDVVEKG
jgi:hypothetical protein